ncbi:hypothetical protein SESBI_34173 [Sesbania bispinosa]|nr:hypothetical protein SESBI_34173 [Sesbania bispinosa]
MDPSLIPVSVISFRTAIGEAPSVTAARRRPTAVCLIPLAAVAATTPCRFNRRSSPSTTAVESCIFAVVPVSAAAVRCRLLRQQVDLPLHRRAWSTCNPRGTACLDPATSSAAAPPRPRDAKRGSHRAPHASPP